MKINTKIIVNALNGKPMLISDEDGKNTRPWTIGEVVADTLISNVSGGKMKMFTLAQDFYTKDEVNLSTTDFALVRQIVDECKCFTSALPSARVLEYFDTLETKD